MPGAGSLRSANWLYNAAPKDGSVIGMFSRGMAMEPLIGASQTQFDAQKFSWLGSGTGDRVIVQGIQKVRAGEKVAPSEAAAATP